MTAKSWLFSQEKLQLLIYLVSWFGLLAGHELLFQLQLFVYSVGHISLYDELQPTDSWRRLTADACFALCTARGAWQMGNCSAECRDGHGICSLCEWHFRMQFLPVCQSTICPPPRYPIRIRVLDICCFITLVKCIQFNAPFFLHSAILGLARKRHANESATLISSFIYCLRLPYQMSSRPAMLLHGSVLELPFVLFVSAPRQ